MEIDSVKTHTYSLEHKKTEGGVALTFIYDRKPWVHVGHAFIDNFIFKNESDSFEGCLIYEPSFLNRAFLLEVDGGYLKWDLLYGFGGLSVVNLE